MASHYVFSIRTETGELRRYGFRADGRTAAYLDKLPNRSEFIRSAVENEIARRSGGGAAGALSEEMTERLARVEEAVQQVLSLLSRSSPPRSVVEASAQHERGRGQEEDAPAVSDLHDPAGGDPPESDSQTSAEELDRTLRAILNIGQQKGGDRA